MKFKSIWTLVSVMVLAAMILSACGTPATTQAPAASAATTAPEVEATTAPAPEMVTIRWRTRPDNQAEQDVYQKINDQLNVQLASQGITLVYDPAPVTGYEDKLKAELAAGNAPDVFWIPGASTADYAKIGLIADLKPFADSDPTFKVTDYYEAPMKELQNGGHLWGIPRDISTLVMYYNKDLFKKYNVDDPATLAAEGKWDLANFERVAKELTHPEDKVYGFSFSNWWGLWGWFVNVYGGNLFNADRTACGLTDSKSQAGLQFMADLFQKDKVAPYPGMEGGISETEWHAGTVGMYPNGRWMVPSDRSSNNFEWAVVEMPKGEVQSTWLFWGPYVMSAKSAHQEQAWTVIKALTSGEVQAQIAALGTNIPSNKAQVGVDAFLASKPPEDNQPFLSGAAYAQAEIPLFTGNWGDIVNGQYQPAIDNILSGKLSVADATKAACDASNPLFIKP